MRSNVEDRLYRELFGRQQAVDGLPVVPLGEIVHWAMVARALGLADLPLHRVPAYVAAGYFYAVDTAPPDHEAVRRAIEAGAAHRAAILFPAVRSTPVTAPLAAAGFAALPWFLEGEYHVRAGVDEDLRAQLGGKRHRELRRLERLADADHRTVILTGEELAGAPRALRAFARLHALNLQKYGHPRNQYPLPALERIVASPLGPRLLVLLRTPRRSARPVQALLGVLDPDRRRVVVPVHGIDHRRVARRHNLYVTGVSALYRWGAERGIAVFGLGRGAERTKLDLGANVFHRLDNHLHPGGLAALDGLEELSRACDARLDGGLEALGAAVRRRDAEHLVRLPDAALVHA